MDQPPATTDLYTITWLGSTDLYDVYDVVIDPALIRDGPALARYREQVSANLERARQAQRKVWGAVDLSRFSVPQLIALAYKAVLPFIREPMIFKVYGTRQVNGLDENTRTLSWLMMNKFKMVVVDSRADALPSGFVVGAQHRPES
jgi:hypothetical protein